MVHVNIFGRGGLVIVAEVSWECPPLIPSVPSSPSQCLNSPVQVMSFQPDFQVIFLLNTLTTHHFYLLLLFNNRQMRREKSAKVFEVVKKYMNHHSLNITQQPESYHTLLGISRNAPGNFYLIFFPVLLESPDDY